MAYKTSWEENGIKWVYSGTLTNDDLFKSNGELYVDARFPLIKYELCDYTGVQTFALDLGIVKEVAKLDAEQYPVNPNIKVAIIGNRLVAKGLANMYRMNSDTFDKAWEVQYFESEEDARTWINSS